MKHYSYIYLIIIFIIVIGVFLAYTYTSDIDALTHIYAEIETINTIDPKVTSATLIFTINITNPTSREIHDLSSTFDVKIDNNYIGSGSFSKISLSPHSNIFKKMNMTVYYSGLADAGVDIIKNWAKGNDSHLTIDGTMHAFVLFGFIETSQEFSASTE